MTVSINCDSLPLVSVAIATYNGSQFLREQLDSIYEQTYTNLEVVVSDDCSTDGTVEILDEYREKYGLRYSVNEINQGLVKNFEKAISMCSGDFISLSDQDDIWKPEKIETLVREIGDYTLIYSPTSEVIDEVGKPINDTGTFLLAEWGTKRKDIFSTFGTGKPVKMLIASNWVVSHQLMFKQELIDVALPISDSHDYHDGWLAICAAKMNGIKFLDASLILYRWHSTSLTFRADDRQPNKLGNTISKMYSKLPGLFDYSDKNKFATERNIDRLNDIYKLSLLDEDEKSFIKLLISYYSDLGRTSLFHLKAFFIFVNNLELMAWGRFTLSGKLVAALKVLVR